MNNKQYKWQKLMSLIGALSLLAIGCSSESNPTTSAAGGDEAFAVTVLSVQYADGFAPAAKVAGTDRDARTLARAEARATREIEAAAREAAREAAKIARETEAATREADRALAQAARAADREALKAARAAAQAARVAAREALRMEREAARAEAIAAREAERAARAEAREEAAIQKDLENRQDAREIGPSGGILRVGSKMGVGGRDDIRATLRIPENALDETLPLTMELQGSTLSDITLVFGPSLDFNEPARLVIRLGRAAVDLDQDTVIALHMSGADGTVEEVPIRMATGVLGLELEIKVPGFSRYSLGGGA